MGLAKLFIAGVTMAVMTVFAPTVFASAQKGLGSALMLGEGIETDMIEALKWFIVSARAGNKDASAYAGRIARFMTRQQQLEARKKAIARQKACDEKKKTEN